jgi:hypothetical protein
MWTHQYDQMTNQVECAPLPPDKVVFMTNGNVSHTFGVEPNYGCCTANLSQGWPKFALSTFMRDKEGIVSAVLAPSVLKTEIDGSEVNIELITDYPFRNKLKYKINASASVDFSLKIRIPAFVPSYKIDGISKSNDDGYYTVSRLWNGENTITIELAYKTEFIKRPNDMVCVKHGPLVYSVAIDEEWEKHESIRDGESIVYPYCDFYVHPRSDWNYAFISNRFTINEHNFDIPFSTKNPPVSITAEMVQIPWNFNNGVCAAIPDSREPISEKQSVKLIPYGCTSLRMTEMPCI